MRSQFLGGCLTASIVLMLPSVYGQTASYGTCPPGTPREQAQHGWQQQSQGRWVEAEACLRAAMAVADDPWVREHRAQLDPSLRRVGENVGGLQVLGGVPGARVRVDGTEVATLPMDHAIRIEATTILIEVVADGYRTAERRVDVSPGEHARVETIPLVPLAPEPVAIPTTPTVTVPVTVPSTTPPPTDTPATLTGRSPITPHPRDEAPVSSPLRTAGWIGVIAGGAAIVGGIVALAVRETQITMAVNHGCNDELPADGAGDCSSLHASTSLLEPLGIALLIAGGVLGGGGAAAVFATQTSAGHEPPTTGPRLGWGGASGTTRVGWDGAF